MARSEARARQLMTIPGVGALTSLTFVAAIDQVDRFSSSRQVGAHFGLTPRKYQSGETDYSGRISKCGDVAVRTALFEAANVMMMRSSCVGAAGQLGTIPACFLMRSSKMIFRNPKTVHSPIAAYSHQIEVSEPARWLALSGQIGQRLDGTVPADPIEQVEAALTNLTHNLAAIIHETGLLGSIAWPARGKVAFWRTRPLPAERGGISG